MSAEHNLISHIANLFGQASQKLIGDDCAELFWARNNQSSVLVSTDAMVEGIHFLPSIKPYFLGWKIVSVNVSDIAAMGGIPKNIFLAASLPKDKTLLHANNPQNWMNEFLRGIYEACQEYQVTLSGGDLTTASQVYLCASIVGQSQVDSRNNSKTAKRSSAKAGQVVAVSKQSQNKALGFSAAGLWALKNKPNKYPLLEEAHQKPIARVDEGLKLLKKSTEPIAIMDTSDGLLDCLQQISSQSKVCLKVELDSILKIQKQNPEFIAFLQESQTNAAQITLTGGEDYELLACCNANNLSDDWTIIGEVLPAEELKRPVAVFVNNELLDLSSLKCFEHF